jgi:hypothetical protein
MSDVVDVLVEAGARIEGIEVAAPSAMSPNGSLGLRPTR